jgi:hypothetical protein
VREEKEMRGRMRTTQGGKMTSPSGALNSMTPQCVIFVRALFDNSKINGNFTWGSETLEQTEQKRNFELVGTICKDPFQRTKKTNTDFSQS